MKPTPVFLPGKSHGQRSLVAYSPQDHKELDTTAWLHTILMYTMVVYKDFISRGIEKHWKIKTIAKRNQDSGLEMTKHTLNLVWQKGQVGCGWNQKAERAGCHHIREDSMSQNSFSPHPLSLLSACLSSFLLWTSFSKNQELPWDAHSPIFTASQKSPSKTLYSLVITWKMPEKVSSVH